MRDEFRFLNRFHICVQWLQPRNNITGFQNCNEKLLKGRDNIQSRRETDCNCISQLWLHFRQCYFGSPWTLTCICETEVHCQEIAMFPEREKTFSLFQDKKHLLTLAFVSWLSATYQVTGILEVQRHIHATLAALFFKLTLKVLDPNTLLLKVWIIFKLCAFLWIIPNAIFVLVFHVSLDTI